MKAALATLLLAVSLSAAVTAAPDSDKPKKKGALTAESLETATDKGGRAELRYLRYEPRGTKPADGWPLLVFLHGAGERGSDLEMLKKHGPTKLAGNKRELKDFYLIAPQCPADRWWDLTAVKELIDKTLADAPVDRTRVYLTGLSMGGYATWGLLAAHPEMFAAAIPICGGGDPATAEKFKNVPVWAFHGTDDEAVPHAGTVALVDGLKKAGGDVKFTSYPGVGHDSWTQTYDNPEIYQWLLSHHLKK